MANTFYYLNKDNRYKHFSFYLYLHQWNNFYLHFYFYFCIILFLFFMDGCIILFSHSASFSFLQFIYFLFFHRSGMDLGPVDSRQDTILYVCATKELRNHFIWQTEGIWEAALSEGKK